MKKSMDKSQMKADAELFEKLYLNMLSKTTGFWSQNIIKCVHFAFREIRGYDYNYGGIDTSKCLPIRKEELQEF